mmetsp:Transcript_39531/g.77222  ORF Transcript_39531/g.77222 Transcript_39531/m.77222 type:complete len:237 (+) Transcript_39531:256-966(+)
MGPRSFPIFFSVAVKQLLTLTNVSRSVKNNLWRACPAVPVLNRMNIDSALQKAGRCPRIVDFPSYAIFAVDENTGAFVITLPVGNLNVILIRRPFFVRTMLLNETPVSTHGLTPTECLLCPTPYTLSPGMENSLAGFLGSLISTISTVPSFMLSNISIKPVSASFGTLLSSCLVFWLSFAKDLLLMAILKSSFLETALFWYSEGEHHCSHPLSCRSRPSIMCFKTLNIFPYWHSGP